MDSAFLFNCIGCSHCFGCVNLRNQKYHIFNEKYTKGEYEKEVQKWNLGSYKTTQKARDLWKKETVKKAMALEALLEKQERKK
jgi:hypothetical protein